MKKNSEEIGPERLESSAKTLLWFYADIAVLGWLSFTAIGGLIHNLLEVDAFYVPSVFAYPVAPASLLIFAIFGALLVVRKRYSLVIPVTMFAAGAYDVSSTFLRLPGGASPFPSLYFMDYIVWGIMIILPIVLLRSRTRLSLLLIPFEISLFLANVFIHLDLRYLFETFFLIVVWDIFRL